jgi:hypothetical protein
MTDNIRVVEATPSDGKTVGGMVHALLAELFPESTADFDQDKMCSTAATLLAGGSGVWG